MNNENKKLSRHKERRIERKIKMDDKMKTIFKELNLEKNTDEIKQIEVELATTKYANYPDKLQSELKELNKIQFINKKLHETEYEIIVVFAGVFEMVENYQGQIGETHLRFRSITESESYINVFDEGYDAEDSIFDD